METIENNIKKSTELEKEGKRIYKKAKKLKQGKQKAIQFREAGNKYFEALIKLEFVKPSSSAGESTKFGKDYNLRQKNLYNKIANCWEESAKASPDLYWQMSFWASAGETRNRLIKLFKKEEILKECKEKRPYLYSWEGGTLSGRAAMCYRNATSKAIKIGENLEEQNHFRKAALLYGTAGDFECSIAKICEDIPIGHLFHDPKYVYEHLYYAAECYLKSAKLNNKIGVPSVVGKNRLLDSHTVNKVGDLFKYRDESTNIEYTYSNDIDRAKVIYKLIKDKNGDKNLKAYAQYRLSEIKRESSMEGLPDPYVYQNIGVFISRFRRLILKALGKDWRDKLSQSILKKIGKPPRENMEIENIDIDDFKPIVQENWDVFEGFFKGLMNQNTAVTYLEVIHKNFRIDMAHYKKNFTRRDGLIANYFISEFNKVFEKYGII